MRELRLENHLREARDKLRNWAQLICHAQATDSEISLTNIAEYMLQEAYRIDVTLEIKESN